MARLDIKDSTLKKLFALSGNWCVFPGCGQAVVNEHEDLIADVCHIEAANEGGERYNRDQSDEDRRSFDNLLILCPNHHKKTQSVRGGAAEGHATAIVGKAVHGLGGVGKTRLAIEYAWR